MASVRPTRYTWSRACLPGLPADVRRSLPGLRTAALRGVRLDRVRSAGQPGVGPRQGGADARHPAPGRGTQAPSIRTRVPSPRPRRLDALALPGSRGSRGRHQPRRGRHDCIRVPLGSLVRCTRTSCGEQPSGLRPVGRDRATTGRRQVPQQHSDRQGSVRHDEGARFAPGGQEERPAGRARNHRPRPGAGSRARDAEVELQLVRTSHWDGADLCHPEALEAVPLAARRSSIEAACSASPAHEEAARDEAQSEADAQAADQQAADCETADRSAARRRWRWDSDRWQSSAAAGAV